MVLPISHRGRFCCRLWIYGETVIFLNSICFSFLVTVYLVTAVTNRLKGLFFWQGLLDWQLLPANSRTSFGGSNTPLP
jgi:hypothetical protein